MKIKIVLGPYTIDKEITPIELTAGREGPRWLCEKQLRAAFEEVLAVALEKVPQ